LKAHTDSARCLARVVSWALRDTKSYIDTTDLKVATTLYSTVKRVASTEN